MSLEIPKFGTEQVAFEPGDVQVQIPLEFAADFSAASSRAKERVWLQCMDFEMGHASGLIQNALASASSRGINTKLTFDYFAVGLVNDKISWIPKRDESKNTQRVMQQADKEMFGRLRNSGVEVTVTNPKVMKFIPATIFPFIERNHMKISIVDDTVWFGGVNVASDHFEKADFMVKIKDQKIADELGVLFDQVNKDKPKEDFKKEINKDYTLLVDRGSHFKSLIYEEAQTLIKSANINIRFISQLPPSGRILQEILDAAKRGVDISIIVPAVQHLDSNSIPFGLLSKVSFNKFKKKIANYPNIHVHHFEGHHGKVHAKVITVDGKKALWGSHNLAYSGVIAGTQEASMLTSDIYLIEKLDETFEGIKNGTFNLGYQEGPFNPQRK